MNIINLDFVRAEKLDSANHDTNTYWTDQVFEMAEHYGFEAPAQGWRNDGGDEVVSVQWPDHLTEYRQEQCLDKVFYTLYRMDLVTRAASSALHNFQTDEETEEFGDYELYQSVDLDFLTTEDHSADIYANGDEVEWRITLAMAQSPRSIRAFLIDSAARMVCHHMLYHSERPTDAQELRAWLECWAEDGPLFCQIKRFIGKLS